MRWSPDGRECQVKLVIAGAPGSGKLEIMTAVARRYGAADPAEVAFGGNRLFRTGWIDSDRLSHGRELRIELLTLHDAVPYNAAEELLMREVDGAVFVIDIDPEKLKQAWEALLRVSDNAQRNGYELRSIPLALQYHRADRHPRFEPAKLDAWLGVPSGQVPRFVTSSSSPDLEGMAFDSILAQLARRLDESEAAA